MSQYAPCNRPLLRDQLKAYADRQLPYMLRRQVRRHLGQCASCREELADMENISRQLHSDDEAQNAPLAADLRARILASVPVGVPDKSDRKRHSLTPVRRPLYIWGAGATAVIAWFALYPTLSRYNHGATLLSNTKQIGTASLMYTQDYDSVPKPAMDTLSAYQYAPNPAHGTLPTKSQGLMDRQAAGSTVDEYAASESRARSKSTPADSAENADTGLGVPGFARNGLSDKTTEMAGVHKRMQVAAAPKAALIGKIDKADALLDASDSIERTVHHEGDITVQVDKVEQISEQVTVLAQGTGGFVASTQLTTEENSLKSATLVLKVPVARFDSTLAAVSHLGEVKAKNISGEDLTEKISDEQAQQNVLQDDANMIQAKIKDGQGRRAQNEEQLRQLRVKVAQTKARLVLLKKLGALSTITVNLNEKPLPAPPPPPPPATGLMADVHDTMQDALHSLSQAAHMPILLLIWMIAYAPLWVVIYLGYRYMSRTRYRLR